MTGDAICWPSLRQQLEFQNICLNYCLGMGTIFEFSNHPLGYVNRWHCQQPFVLKRELCQVA